MNIFVFELRSQMKSFIVWTASILLFFAVSMTSLFQVFMDAKEAMVKVYSGFPPAFAEAFGIFIDTIFTYGGFYSFIHSYVALVGAIMASSISISVFSREKRSRCTDFLLSKPSSRGSIFLSKLLSCLALLVLANALFVAASAAVYGWTHQDPALSGRAATASLSLFFTQALFMSLGTLYATCARKVRSVSGSATAFGFAGFILSALPSLLEEEALRFLAPLKYFDPAQVFSTGGFEAKYALTAAAVAAACLSLSYLKYAGEDSVAL